MKSIVCKIGIHKSVNTDGRGMAGEWKCVRCGKVTHDAIVWPRCRPLKTIHSEYQPKGQPQPTGANDMADNAKDKLTKVIEHLADRATEGGSADAVLKFTEAALNAAQAIQVLALTKSIGE